MKLLSIVGARPQFIKVAAIAGALPSRVRGKSLEHRILHTGQHYDADMSDCFFEELGIPLPTYQLGVGSGHHGAQTGQMLAGIEEVLTQLRPDAVIVYGDTNSTVAGALAAAKLHVASIHLEAGLRSFNRRMPEEINRVATDHLCDVLLCPTATAMANAQREGLGDRCWLSGDVMLDLLLRFAPSLDNRFEVSRPFVLVTVHRAENTDDPDRLSDFVRMLEELPLTVVLPMHPRLRARLSRVDLARVERMRHVRLLGPCGYRETIALARNATAVLTDSGGLQKEAYFLGVPCLTLRHETEWTETLTGDWNRIVGMDPVAVNKVVLSLLNRNGCLPSGKPDLAQFGGGVAVKTSVEVIVNYLEGTIG